jgi:hypothetical protein
VLEDGVVKILDFGLAKAMLPEAQGAARVSASLSPTLTLAATQRGEILGTAGYMSPEQARGKTVDKRTDVWAFGCCLFEALTGRGPFAADTALDSLARIVEREPQWDELPPSTPRKLNELLSRCLHKDSRQRLHDIGDARIEIAEILDEADNDKEKGQARPTAKPAERRKLITWSATSALVAAALSALVVWQVSRPSIPEATPTIRFSVSLPLDTRSITDAHALSLSADGNRLVFVAVGDEGPQLYLRELDTLESTLLEGTRGAVSPHISPDGENVLFIDVFESKLVVLSLAGGAPRTVWDGDVSPYPSWLDNETVVFTRDDDSTMVRMPVAGGEQVVLATKDPDGTLRAPVGPHVLPGGNALLLSAFDTGTAKWRIEALSLDSGERHLVVEEGRDPVYVPSGHLLFSRQSGSVGAVPFDLETLEVLGPPRSVLENMQYDRNGYFDVSASGTLAWVPSLSDEVRFGSTGRDARPRSTRPCAPTTPRTWLPTARGSL